MKHALWFSKAQSLMVAFTPIPPALNGTLENRVEKAPWSIHLHSRATGTHFQGVEHFPL